MRCPTMRSVFPGFLILSFGLAANLSAQEGFIRIPAGSFLMGSPASEANRSADEGPQHEVRIASLAIGQYEVTQAEWVAVMGDNPSQLKGERLPVDSVSWYEILVYCNRRSLAEGLHPCYSINGSTDPASWGAVPSRANGVWNAVVCEFSAQGYRLPTEAEWEYACRAGTRSATAFGDALDPSQANFDWSKPYQTSATATPRRSTVPAGSYAANAWGLHDTHGNVWEWCWDHYADNYYARSPEADPPGAEGGRYRVMRGGSWTNAGYRLRSAARRDEDPFYRDVDNGFRLVRGE